MGFRTEFQFCFNRGAYNFFRELKESNVGTLFRDLNINYFIYREYEETFLGFEKLRFESVIYHQYYRSNLTYSKCEYLRPIVHANTLDI